LYPEAKYHDPIILREAMFTFLKVILHDAMVFMRHFHRHTIVANDIMHSAKRYGKVAYGV
jgi:histone H3/H4